MNGKFWGRLRSIENQFYAQENGLPLVIVHDYSGRNNITREEIQADIERSRAQGIKVYDFTGTRSSPPGRYGADGDTECHS